MYDCPRRHFGRRVGALATALLLSACASGAGSPTASPATPTPAVTATLEEPTSEPSPSLSPTPSPSPSVAGNPPATATGALARVTVADLVVRIEPSASGAPLDSLNGVAGPVVLNPGEHVLVLGDPQAADGQWWVPVAVESAQDSRSNDLVAPAGWIPGGTQAEPTIVEDTPACPSPGVAALGGLSTLLRIVCFGSQTVEFDAHQASEPTEGGLGGACGGLAPRPDWLLCDNINYNWVNADGGPSWTFLLHFDPAVGIPEINLAPAGSVGPAYHITGHFSDPASKRCAPAGLDPASLQAQGFWVLCASKFVVETLNLLG